MSDSEYHYTPEHWSTAQAVSNYKAEDVAAIPVNDRAATRQAIITTLAHRGYRLIERSSWHAKPGQSGMRPSNWDYHDIVIHHAGRSYSCGAPSIDEIRRAQAEDMAGSDGFHDIGYHYAVSCQGEIYEARDIRFFGEHVLHDNTGKIGIVFLADFVQAGEAYEQEYKSDSFFKKMYEIRDILIDQAIVRHDKPTELQVQAVTALCGVLKEFFNITRLGGHREYQKLANNLGRACPGNIGMDVVKLLRNNLAFSAPSAKAS
ncbi:peptidoglycan recognition protein family protein [Robbsia andropogonis]|uniref:peptidoglycan recognition protein family protein n=1 Tax=Robbsia andropogonis TaxID=28092 RepID=UPI0020A157A6|nr:peptidoglycan recognition family protein [Robbsia andropogonis]MCP1116928.1 peptidoglycan recognition protein family protein [Robbsia andropogonis]MCP1126393.1 peptidoglycan recognition protein family protein [Robbsia andropogonis]